jgi:UDP-N-acetylmuramate--alanine ligase
MDAFFVGIGGMGMSGLAKILFTRGARVAGSDRNLAGEYCQRLLQLGIPIYPQDGEGPRKFLADHRLAPEQTVIVKSTAVEDQVTDIVTARQLGIREIMRSDLLADLFNAKQGVAIGGTAGKTTTTGLAAWLLKFAGLEPSCAVGGIISGLETNAFDGPGAHFVIEADESDGSIVKYRPAVAILTNITRDHKSLDELQELFLTYLNHVQPTGTCILCGDDPTITALRSRVERPIVTYGLGADCEVRPERLVLGRDHLSFSFGGTTFEASLPGPHNAQNVLAVIALAKVLHIPLDTVAAALRAFPGMKRRFERIGTSRGITVIDDFAHNPAEIQAAITTARQTSRRRFIVYQPHGYGPTRFTRPDLVKVFSTLQADEYLYLDDIYYGGGTVEKDISSREIVDEVKSRFPNAFYFGSRDQIVDSIVHQAQEGDMVLVMGARDINVICRRILDGL